MELIYIMGTDFFNHKEKVDLVKSCEKRLKHCPFYHYKNEEIAAAILSMMLEKTKLYGGDSMEGANRNFKISKSYFEGVSRKASRMDSLVELSLAGDDKAFEQLIDSFVDMAGYSIMALNNLSEEIKKIKYEKF